MKRQIRLLEFFLMLLALLLMQGCVSIKATRLQVSAEEGDLSSVKKEIEKGSVLDSIPKERGGWGCSALYFATLNGHMDVVKYLLAKGADPRYSCSSCAHGGSIGKYLAKSADQWHTCPEKSWYADSTGSYPNPSTPWAVAFMKGQLELCKLYIANGIKIEETDEWGRSPMHFAIQTYPNNPCVSYLKGLGANINKVDKLGLTPFSWLLTKSVRQYSRLNKNRENALKLSEAAGFYAEGGRPAREFATLIMDHGGLAKVGSYSAPLDRRFIDAWGWFAVEEYWHAYNVGVEGAWWKSRTWADYELDRQYYNGRTWWWPLPEGSGTVLIDFWDCLNGESSYSLYWRGNCTKSIYTDSLSQTVSLKKGNIYVLKLDTEYLGEGQTISETKKHMGLTTSTRTISMGEWLLKPELMIFNGSGLLPAAK